MTRPDGEQLVAGRFLDLCADAVTLDAPERLEPHTRGDTPEIAAIRDTAGTEARARAIAYLAVACCPSTDARGENLAAAVEAWTHGEFAALQAREEVGAPATPAEVSHRLDRLCEAHHDLRLEQLADVATRVLGKEPGRTGRATTGFPVRHTGGRLLRFEVGASAVGPPGLRESVDGVLAVRDHAWRAMECVVEEYLLRRFGSTHCFKYSIRDVRQVRTRRHASYFSGSLSGSSAGLALAMAAQSALRGRLAVGVDPAVAATGTVDYRGCVGPIEGLSDKLTPDLEFEPDEHSIEKRRKQYLSQFGVLVVSDRQDGTDVPKDVSLRKVETVDAAVRFATRRRLRAPTSTALVLASVVVAIGAIVTSPSSRSDRSAEARRQLPAKIAAATSRLRVSDPDLADLLRVEQASVQPSDNAVHDLIEVYRRAAERTLTIHPSGIPTAVRFSHDGTELLVGERNGLVEAFSAQDGRRLDSTQHFKPYEGVYSISLSEDGSRVLYVAGRSLRIARTSSSATGVTFSRAGIVAAAFTDDARDVVVGGKGQVGVIHGPAFGRVSWTALDTTDWVADVARADRRHPVLCLSRDGTSLRLERADLDTGQLTPIQRSAKQLDCDVASVAGARWIGVSADHVAFERARLTSDDWHVQHRYRAGWRVKGIERVPGTESVFAAGTSRVESVSSGRGVHGRGQIRPGWRAVTIDRSGSRVAAGYPTGEVIVSPLLSPMPGSIAYSGVGRASAVAWATQRSRLLVGGDSGSLELIDLDHANRSRTIALPFGGVVRAVAIDAQGETGWAAGTAGEVVRLDLTRTHAKPTTSASFTRVVSSLALSPDERELAVGGSQGAGIALVDADTLRTSAQDDTIDITAITWLSNRRLLAASGVNGDDSKAAIRVLDERLRATGRTLEVGGAGYLDLERRVGTTLVAASGTTVALIDVRADTPRLVTERPSASDAGGVSWTPDGRQVVATSDAGLTVLSATVGLQEIGVLPGGGAVRSAARGNRLALVNARNSTVRFRGLGAAAWSREICRRLNRSLTPLEWLRQVGQLPPFKKVCAAPRA